MANISIQLKGVEQFARLAGRMRHLPREVHDTLTKAIRAEADLLATQSHRKAPVDTGRLRESFTWQDVGSGQGTIGIVAKYEAPYASFPHAKTKWGKGSVKGVPGTPYPNNRWLEKAARAVGRGLIGRVVRKLRPVLQSIYSRTAPTVH